MPNDLISRSATIADLVEWMDDDTGDEFDRGYDFAMKRAIRRLRSAPDVDAVPVMHARWIWVKDHWECSACRGSRFHDIALGCDASYCGRCGARMDGGDYE